jgi:hypothetical protein
MGTPAAMRSWWARASAERHQSAIVVASGLGPGWPGRGALTENAGQPRKATAEGPKS